MKRPEPDPPAIVIDLDSLYTLDGIIKTLGIGSSPATKSRVKKDLESKGFKFLKIGGQLTIDGRQFARFFQTLADQEKDKGGEK